MDWTIDTFVRARDATARVLEELGLGNYLFEVEPRDDGWEVRVECQARDGWKVTRVPVDREALERSLHDGAARAHLLETFRDRIGDCAVPAQTAGDR